MIVTDIVSPPESSASERPQTENRNSARERRIFIPAWVRDGLLAQLKGAPLAVYLAYLSFANKEGLAWPSIKSLCKVTGYGADAVKDARRYIISVSLITRIKQERGPGKRFGRTVFRVSRGMVFIPRSRGMVSRGGKSRSTEKPSAENHPTKVSPVVKVTQSEGTQRYRSKKSPRVRGTADCGTDSCPTGKKTSPQNLETNIASKIREGAGDGPLGVVDPSESPWIASAHNCAKAIGYTLDENSPLVSLGFACNLAEAWDKHRDAALPAGLLAQKVLDLCVTKGFETPWPPDFQALRDRLRKAERSSEEK